VTAVLAVAGVPVVAVARSIRDIPHSCPCSWQGPDYQLPPQNRRYTLPRPDPSCQHHGGQVAARIPASAPPGPVQLPVLEALAAAGDGLTITELAGVLGTVRTTADQSVRTLRDKGRVRVARYEKRAGKTSGVYVITTAGLAALERARRAAS